MSIVRPATWSAAKAICNSVYRGQVPGYRGQYTYLGQRGKSDRQWEMGILSPEFPVPGISKLDPAARATAIVGLEKGKLTFGDRE